VTAELQAPQPDVPERFIELESCPNFRDLGGYVGLDGRAVRWRQLFRSMTPEYLSPTEARVASRLGIRLVIDLRGQRARTSGPLGTPPTQRLRVGRPHMLAKTRAELIEYAQLRPEEALPRVLFRFGRAYAKAAAAVANEHDPALFHCRLGKDRSGVFAAVMLSALGVSNQDIIDDYMLSNECFEECNHVLAANEEPGTGARSRVASEPASRAAINEVLRLLNDRFGGGAGYLRVHGMRKRDIIALQERLLQQARSERSSSTSANASTSL
jgi:protein-tyrosine phosphatase